MSNSRQLFRLFYYKASTNKYSEGPNSSPLTFRTPYQILPHTENYFHCLYSYLDLLQLLLGYQGGLAPLGYPRGPWRRRRSREL